MKTINNNIDSLSLEIAGREVGKIARKGGWFRRVCVGLVFIAVVLSPTMNVVSRELALTYLVILISICLAALNPLRKVDLFFALISSIFLVNLSDPLFVIKLLPGLILGYIGIQIGKGEIDVSYVLKILLGIHVLLSIAQLTALSDFFYGWATYQNEAESQTDFSAGFLPQVRPSGIFPAPTYASFFIILVFILILSENKSYQSIKPWFFVSAVIAGSTLGLVLLVFLNLLSKPRRGLLRDFFISGMAFACYFYLFPDIFLYNHNAVEFAASVLDRRMDESVLATRGVFFLGLSGLLVFLFFIVFASRVRSIRTINFKSLFIGTCGIFGPLLLHDTGGAAIGGLLVGVGMGIVVRGFRSNDMVMNFRQRLQTCGATRPGPM